MAAVKVTEKMLKRAIHVLSARKGTVSEALEAALADVPDGYKWMAAAYNSDVEGMRCEERAKAAETKLAKLRDWFDRADWHCGVGDSDPYDILDG